ncbi:MAG TPA: hypothetical protein VD838_00500 [Anaeromyxobacteraceae bacterium]|nr:hypothetical protein [Anaeromyxobacteraceae bacterium]
MAEALREGGLYRNPDGSFADANGLPADPPSKAETAAAEEAHAAAEAPLEGAEPAVPKAASKGK